MRNTRMRRWIVTGIVAAGLLGAVGAYAVNTITLTTSSVIYACQSNTNGSLRIVSATTGCKNGETPLQWNVQGVQGDTGPQGSTGPQGVKGDKGDTGATGPAGADSTVPGPTGATGPQGDPGPSGPKGDTGATGATGAAGAQGAKGQQEPGGATVWAKVAADGTLLAGSGASPQKVGTGIYWVNVSQNVHNCAAVVSTDQAQFADAAVNTIDGGTNRVAVVIWAGYDIFGGQSTRDDPFGMALFC